MLLCEVIVLQICQEQSNKQSAYEGAVQQDGEKLYLSVAAAADRLL
jgi:hypothetical protein